MPFYSIQNRPYRTYSNVNLVINKSFNMSKLDIIGKKIDSAFRLYTLQLFKSYQSFKSFSYHWFAYFVHTMWTEYSEISQESTVKSQKCIRSRDSLLAEINALFAGWRKSPLRGLDTLEIFDARLGLLICSIMSPVALKIASLMFKLVFGILPILVLKIIIFSYPSSHRSTMAPTQRAEMKDRQKRARSKSTSNFSEKQKPRVTSSLPRGKSFHSHGPRQLITPSPDANIVILTRRKSEDESYKSDVKLKSFGVKAARSTDDVKSSQTNNGPKILSNGNCSNLPSVSDAVHERQGSSGDISNAQPAVNGRVSLSDAIQSNAVYERLQQRHEDKTEIGPGQTRPETHDNGLSDADTDDVFIQTNVVSFSDAINSSPVLMKVKQKNSKSSSEEQIVDDSVAQFKEGASKCLELVGSSTNSDAVQEINSICATPKSQLITSRAVDKSPDSCSRQIEGEVVQNKDVSGKEINTLSKASDSPERRASQGRPLPPVVKPKPKVQKRPSIDRANQKSFEDQSKTDQVLNAAGQNEKTLKQLPPAIEAECVSAEMSNSSQLINTKVNDAIAEKSLQHSTCHVQTNEKLLLKDEPDSFPSGPLIIKSSKAPKKVTAAGSELIDASHAVKHGADNTSGIVEVADDSKLDKHPINTSDVSMPLHDDVSKTEVDKLLENSNENGDRKKSESEPESSGSIDSLTSIASQVTVIYNPDAPTTPAKDDSTSSTVVGPYESHPTKSRRQSVPEPYSSHRERRPKPAKTQSATLTLKTKNRKSKATIGRRLTSSPPSTPPPPPRTCSLDSESVTTTSDRPPVPPRAPSMYIQSDMRSLDALLNGANKLEKEKSPPPPRPSKPPMLRRAVTLDHRSLKTKADAAVNSSDAMITDTNSRNTTQTENNSSVKSSEKTLNSNSNPRNIAANGAAAGLSASNETQNGTTPTMGFSQKLDFFDRSSKKPKRPPVLPKQQSLDSRLERSAEERVSELSTEQLRKEGKEALELVSRLRKETTELKDNKKGKSPAPQKPKRPLSFSMENFLLSNASDMDKSNETGKAEKKKPPPKPGRPASFLKTSSFDEIKHEVNERPINESEASSTSMASFELRSKDAGLYENLDHLREGKNKPIKPVRTSSLKKEKSDAISKRVATSPNVPEKIEKTCDNVEQAASNLEVVSEKHEKINSKIEVIVENKMSPSSGKNPEKLEGKCEQNDEQTKSNKNTPEKHTEVDKKDVEKVRNDIAVEKSPEKSIASDALSNQIDKLDKLILETSTVHNESVTESLCSIENADDQKVPSECGVEENSIKLSTEDTCYVSSSSEGSAVSKKQEKAIDLSKMRKSEVDNSTVGTVITKPLESATKQRVQTKNDVEIGEGVGVEIFPESSLPQRVIEEAVESKETQVSFVSHDEEIENICSKKAEESKKDQNKEVADSNTHNSIGEGSCSIIGDEKRGNADIQSTASTDRVVAPAGKEDVKSYTENPQNVNNKGNASLQESTNTRATKIAPTKPPRPRSFPKVINTEYLMKSGHITPHDNKQVPARPPLPNDHTRKTANHTVCQKSPPERPNKMPDLHQSKIDESVVTKRKQSPARTARPPIPLILRENSHDSKTEGKSDGDGLMDTIRKKMNVTDPHCIALYDYVSTNETDLNFKVRLLI